jgi:predicted ATPase/DNA-binding SARP family transcriptional activator
MPSHDRVVPRAVISVLGPVQVLHDGQPVDIGSPRHREVLAALVVDAGRVVSTDALLERVWGEGTRGATTANLHAVMSRLRGRLRDAGEPAEVVTAPPGYRLDAPGAVDAVLFQDECARARAAHAAGDLAGARRALDEALGLWRGAAYADIGHPFAEAEAARLDGQRLGAHELAAEIDLALGRHESVLEQLPALVAQHPLRETFRRQLMLALFRAGRQAEALDAYADVRAVLVDELGVDPGPELQALHQRILEQDPGLVPPAPTPAPAAASTAPVVAREWHSEVVVPPNALLGREREVEYLVGLLADSTQRLVTLTGVGGVGKTRVAYAVASAARDHFRDGVAIVSLAPLSDPAMVLPAIGRATGLSAVEGLDPAAALTDHLRTREVLLVLDNAEHLLDAAAALSRLVASCPGVTALVTSRSTLRVRGELQYQLSPLSIPDPAEADAAALSGSAAVALFVERARDAVPSFVLDDTNAAAVGAICRRLSGIPLALELAAARSRLLTPAVMLARLDEVVAAAGARDLPPRQRTMRAAIDWSYQLLDPPGQRLFRMLAVFSDGFTLDAVEAVAGRDGVFEAIDGLVEHSLIHPDRDHPDVTRFRMLEPVAQFAGSLLQAEEESAARTAHLCHFLALAEATEPGYRGPGTREALTVSEREHANLVAAMEWGLRDGQGELAGRLGWALWLFWWLRGNLLEGRRLMQGVLAREEISPEVRVRATAVLGAMTFAQGDLETARCWSDGAALAADTGDRVGESHCVAGVGLVALAEGDLAGAEAAFLATLPLCEQSGLGGGWLWTLAHVWLGTVRLLRGDPAGASEHTERALAAARERQDPLAIYISLFTGAQIALAAGDTSRARRQLDEGILLSVDTGDMANLAYFLDARGVIEAGEGRPRRVALLHGAAGRLRETVGANVYGYYQPDEAMLADALDAARSALGDGFAEVVAEGRRLDVRAVVELATAAA